MVRVNRHEQALSEAQGWAPLHTDFDREPTERFTPCLFARFIGAVAVVTAIAMLAGAGNP